MTRRFVISLLTVLACAAPAATTTSAPAPTLQGGEVATYHPTDEQVAYGIMAASAMKQSRFLTFDKTVGLYQSEDPRNPLYSIVKLIFEDNKFREIHKGEMQLACTVPDRPGLR